MKLMAALCTVAVFFISLSATAGTTVPPEPDLVLSTCSQCHGDRGLSTAPLFPNLAAQDKDYLIAQLKDFRDHKRSDPHAQAYMWGMANRLTDATIDEVATYFSSLPPPAGEKGQNPQEVAAGHKIFENGIKSEDVPACMLCHGKTAAGSATVPRLAGQHREYLAAQLLAFRTDQRKNPIMHANAEHLTDEQIRDVAAYLSSL